MRRDGGTPWRFSLSDLAVTPSVSRGAWRCGWRDRHATEPPGPSTHARDDLKLPLDHHTHPVAHAVPQAPRVPAIERPLHGERQVVLERAPQLLGDGRVVDRDGDLVVDVERARIEVRRAD